MDYHQNARLTIHLAAASFNASARTAAKWVRRYWERGPGISVRPQFTTSSTAPFYFRELVGRVDMLRRQRWTGHRIALKEWADARSYQNSNERNQERRSWLRA